MKKTRQLPSTLPLPRLEPVTNQGTPKALPSLIQSLLVGVHFSTRIGLDAVDAPYHTS